MSAFDQGMSRRAGPMLARQAAAEAAWLASNTNPGSGSESLLQQRERRIREAAYFKAQRRGFAPGHELEDWVAAEQEVDQASRPLPRQ